MGLCASWDCCFLSFTNVVKEHSLVFLPFCYLQKKIALNESL